MTSSSDNFVKPFREMDQGSPLVPRARLANLEQVFLGCLLLDPVAADRSPLADVLQNLGESTQSSGVVHFGLAPGSLMVRDAWWADGSVPDISPMPLPWVASRMRRQVVVALGENLEGLDPEAQEDAGRLHHFGIGQALFLPLMLDGEIHGGLGFFRPRGGPRWVREEINTLQIATTILATSIQRRKLECDVLHKKTLIDKLEKLGDREALESAREQLLDQLTGFTTSFKIPSRLVLVPGVADFLVERASPWIEGEHDTMNLKLGLVELLNNAIEHGNLEVTSKEKEDALATSGNYDALIDERLSDENLSKRLVHLTINCSFEGVEWLIEDEGSGFDWRKAWEKIQNTPNLTVLSGRGLFLCNHCFDELEYSGRGNKVRAYKKRKVLPADFETELS